MPNNRNRNPFKKGVTKKSKKGDIKKKTSVNQKIYITDYFPVIGKQETKMQKIQGPKNDNVSSSLSHIEVAEKPGTTKDENKVQDQEVHECFDIEVICEVFEENSSDKFQENQ